MPITLTNSPAGTDLITTSRAIEISSLSDLNTSNPAALGHLITAASQAIERTCRRIFAAQNYSLFLNSGPTSCDWVALPHFPVLSITRLATSPAAAISIVNTDSATNQRAAIATTTTGLQLTRIASGVNSVVTLLFATYPTLTALAAAVTAAGNGWSATVINPYGNFPSADLRPQQGASPALITPASLEIFTEELQPWGSAQNVWDWAGGDGAVGCGWQLDADAGLLVGRFVNDGGALCLRCDYRAGFETIPADVQQACARLAALMQEDELRNTTVQEQTIGPYKQRYFSAASKLVTNPSVMELIAPYIDHAKMLGRV